MKNHILRKQHCTREGLTARQAMYMADPETHERAQLQGRKVKAVAIGRVLHEIRCLYKAGCISRADRNLYSDILWSL